MHSQALIVLLFLLAYHAAEAVVIVRVNDITTRGKTFRVVCAVHDESFVGWFKKDGTKVTSSSHWDKFYVIDRGSDHTLVVKDVVVPDGGTYQCRGSRSSKNFTLYVEFYVTEAPANQEFTANKKVKIKCSAVGYTDPVYRWFKYQEEIDPKKDPRFRILRNGKLVVDKIQVQDTGNYTCRITQLSFLSRTREEERRIQVIVYAPPSINKEKSSSVVYTYIGNPKKIRIRCTFWGFPLPDIKLTGKKMHKSAKSTNIIKGTIKAQDIGVSLGNYTCMAQNRLGKAEHTIVVKEAGPPMPPTNITTDSQCDCLTVSWEPPQHTGGFPISLYIQELRFNGTVVTAANVGSSPRTYTFTHHLKPNTEYRITVAGRTEAKLGKSAVVIVRTSSCPPSGEMFILNKETILNTTNLTVKWTRPPNDGGDQDITYIVEYSRANTHGAYVNWNSRRGIKQQELDVTGLVRGSTYLFHVVAVNSVGRNRQTAQKSFRVRAGPVLSTRAPTSSGQGPVIDPDLVYDMAVNCTSRLIQVVFALKFFPGLNFNSFQLADSSCTPDKVTNTHVTISTRLDGCATKRNQTNTVITYSNKAIARVENSRSRIYIVEFPFSCSYNKKQLVGVPSFQPRRKISMFEAGFGNFSFLMKLFPSSDYKNPYRISDYPVHVDPSRTLYCQVELVASDSNLVIFADSCIATPSMDPFDQTRYTFLKHGCRVDETLRYVYRPNSPLQRFTIQPFKFNKASQPMVYLHCTVLVCHAGDLSSTCARGCEAGNRRRRRESNERNRVHRITLGPIVADEEVEGQRTSPQLNTATQPLVKVIIFVVLGVALVVNVPLVSSI